MISAVFRAAFFGDRRRWLGFRIAGHADFDDPGRDIVCAAVSALSQAAVIGITEVVGVPATWNRDAGELSLDLPFDDGYLEATDVLLETVYLALADLSEQYPGELGVRIVYSNERGR